MTDNLIRRAQALVPTSRSVVPAFGRKEYSLEEMRKIFEVNKSKLDVYLAFDTTSSMKPYVSSARQNIGTVTEELLKNNDAVRISVNGIGDHCDGNKWMQRYALSSKPKEVHSAIESIVMTYGGDEPEAYECLALVLTQRLQKESAGRKRAVVLVGDSVPHGMIVSQNFFSDFCRR